jgi:hypothetical protein
MFASGRSSFTLIRSELHIASLSVSRPEEELANLLRKREAEGDDAMRRTWPQRIGAPLRRAQT